MRAFDVFLNRKKLCSAGIGDDGVLSAIVNWVTGRDRGDLFMEVGGLISPTDEHVAWIQQRHLRVGDRVEIKVVEAETVDKPLKKYRIDPARELRAKRRYVRRAVKQLGWKIQTRPKRTSR